MLKTKRLLWTKKTGLLRATQPFTMTRSANTLYSSRCLVIAGLLLTGLCFFAAEGKDMRAIRLNTRNLKYRNTYLERIIDKAETAMPVDADADTSDWIILCPINGPPPGKGFAKSLKGLKGSKASKASLQAHNCFKVPSWWLDDELPLDTSVPTVTSQPTTATTIQPTMTLAPTQGAIIDSEAPTLAATTMAPVTSAPTTVPVQPTLSPSQGIDTTMPTISPTPLVTVVPTVAPTGKVTALPTTLPVETVAPTVLLAAPTVSPSQAVVTSAPSLGMASVAPTIASAPTNLGDIRSTPFNVQLTSSQTTDPTQENLDEASVIVQNYLDAYFVETFELSLTADLVDFVATQIGSSPGSGTSDLSYDATASFAPTSELMPTQADIDILIQTALSPPRVNTLIEELATLPSDNPLSTVTIATYTPETAVTEAASVVDSDSSVALYAAVVGASLVVVVASFLWVLTKRRQSKEMTMAKEHIMQAKMASSVTSNSNNNEDAIEFCADRNAVDFCDDEAA